jgi:hypothetical protein
VTPARNLLALLEALEDRGTSVIDLVRDGQPDEPWHLYPGERGIFDRHTRCPYYYHRHRAAHEAGHFHTVRLFADHTVHAVAISMAPDGWPQGLFPRNLWAIGDASESAVALKHSCARFRLQERAGPPPLVRFVNLLFQAFRPEIERLQKEKIATLARHRAANPGRNVFEDRSLEIRSQVAIDVRARALGPASSVFSR